MTEVASVMCADGCAGCSAECAACSSSGCGDCGGCTTARTVTAARAASVTLASEHLQLLSDEEAELAFNPNQPRDAKGRWIKGAGGSAPSINTGPNPRDHGNFTPTADARWTQRQKALGRRKPRTDSSGDLKPEDVVPMGDGGWATVVPGKNTARTKGYVQVVRDGEPYSNMESISSIKARIDEYAAEKSWRDAGGSKEQFEGRAGRPASEPEGTPTPGTAKTKRAVKPRTAKTTPAPAPAPDESEQSPDMGSEYIPQHLADVRDYLDGKKKAPLPLSYLYGGVSKESWRKFFSPGQRARVLRESREIRDGMSDDARDKGMLDRAVGWLEEIAAEEAPGYVPSASLKARNYLDGGRDAKPPLPLAVLFGEVDSQSWRTHFTPKQRAKALREAKRELKKIQKGPRYKGSYSDEGLLDRTIRLLEGIESERLTSAAPPPTNL